MANSASAGPQARWARGRSRQQRVGDAAGRRIERDEVVEAVRELGRARERAPRDDRHRAVGEAGHHGLEARRGGAERRPPPPARARRSRRGRRRRRRSPRRGGPRRRRSAGTRRRRGGGARRAARASSSQKGSSSPSTSQLARLRRAERAQDHARLHHSVPAVLLQAQGDVVRLLGRRRERPRRRAERHAAGLRAAGGHEREARVLLLLPHAGHALEARGGHEQGRLRVAHAERAQQLEVLGELETEVAARARSRPPARPGSGRPARAPRAAWAASARRNGSTASASSSTPAAMRWPPKRTRCSEQAARPAWRS